MAFIVYKKELERHVRQRHVELGRSVEGIKPIYLDLNYWITLRETAAGIRTLPTERQLLELLQRGVHKNVLFCPISESVFLELMKQSAHESRLSTALVIDELSRGISLIPLPLRTGTELARLVHSLCGDTNLHPLRHLVWSRLTYALGVVHPTGTPFDKKTELYIQKNFFDHLWNLRLEDMIQYLSDPPLPEHFDAFCDSHNDDLQRHAHELGSFQQSLTAELKGAAELAAPIVADILHDIAADKNPEFPDLTSVERKATERTWYEFILGQLRKGDGHRALPSLYIQACLHAAMRWDKRRTFRSNDLYDFNHAAAALGYCNAFFTENPLRTMLTANNIALGTLFGCEVISNIEEAVTYLDRLHSSAPRSCHEIL